MNQINFIKQSYHSLSPFSAHQINIRGDNFATVEHAYHCARFIECPEREEIKNASSPIIAWQRSQNMKKRPELLNVNFNKDKVMEELFRAKLAQHPDVYEALIATGDIELVKKIETDAYWGTGQDGTGQNRMGKLWMKLREELVENKES